MAKYLLSNGTSTNRLEYYIMDLIKMNLVIYPDDIPGAPYIGFDFIITNTMKSDLESSVTERVNSLINKISDRFSSRVKISLESLRILNDNTVKVVIKVNEMLSEEIEINTYSN